MQLKLHLQNYSLTLVQQTKEIPILRGLNFSIGQDEVVGLIGISGSGKSMTAKSILRLHQALGVLKEDGSIDLTIDNKQFDLLTTEGHREAAKHIGIVFQQSAQVLNPIQKIGKQLTEKLGKRPSSEDKTKIKELLEEVELLPAQRFYDAYPHQLSGGQIQRVLIAMAVINNPKLIIADEPLSALDLATQNEVLELLGKLKEKYKTSILFISHDLNLVQSFCDRLVFIDDGIIIEEGSTVEIFTNPSTELVRKHVSTIQDETIERRESDENKVALFRLTNVSKQYQSEQIFTVSQTTISVLEDYDLEIYEGEVLGLAGPSGSGKSTLGRLLLLLEPMDAGEIFYKDRNLAEFTGRELQNFRRECQIIFQDPFSSMSPHRTVRQHFQDASRVMGIAYDDNLITPVLELVNLSGDLLDRLPAKLSGGQRQRVLIARAIFMEARLIVCDEILSSLDSLVAYSILALLKKIVAKRGLTVLFITHNQKYLKKICDRIIVLKS